MYELAVMEARMILKSFKLSTNPSDLQLEL